MPLPTDDELFDRWSSASLLLLSKWVASGRLHRCPQSSNCFHLTSDTFTDIVVEMASASTQIFKVWKPEARAHAEREALTLLLLEQRIANALLDPHQASRHSVLRRVQRWIEDSRTSLTAMPPPPPDAAA